MTGTLRKSRVGVTLKYLLQLRQLRGGLRLRFSKEPLRLHLGCGQRRLDGFINIDVNPSSATDYVADVARLPCRDNSVERIESYHMIEHIPLQAVTRLLEEWRRVLRPDGSLVIECPDVDQIMREYLDGREERLVGVFGHQRFPGDTHLWGYNESRLRRLLQSVGFASVVSEEPRDYHKNHWPCLRVVAHKGRGRHVV
jgi:predicted SAM-dependent methyltransferase